MEFSNSAVDELHIFAVALGADLGIWGVINLLKGYGTITLEKSRGMKQLVIS